MSDQEWTSPFVLDFDQTQAQPRVEQKHQIRAFQSFGHGTSSSFLCRGMNYDMPSSKTHHAHLTHLITILLLHSNPSSVSSLPTWPYALTQPASEKPPIYKLVWRHTYGSLLCCPVGPKSIIKPP